MARINEFKKWIEKVKKECVKHDESDFNGFENLYGDYKPENKTVRLTFNYCRKTYGDSHSYNETIYLKRKNDVDEFKVIKSHVCNNDRNMGYEKDKKPEDIILKTITPGHWMGMYWTSGKSDYYEPCFKDLNWSDCEVGKNDISVPKLKFMKGIRNLEICIDTWLD